MNWYRCEIREVLESLGSSPEGLAAGEAAKRLEQDGPNELKGKKKRTQLAMLLDQFKDFMIIVLIVAAVVSGLIGEPMDTIAIVVIVVLNAVIGFTQEYRAEKAMAALKKMAAPSAVVVRGGVTSTIPAVDLVPGGIVLIEVGRVVPADLRLAEAVQLKVEEAPLTGESVPVEKTTKVLHEKDLPPGDRK